MDVDMSPDVAPTLEVTDANRRVIERKGGKSGERIQLNTRVAAGTYYLCVSSYYTLDSAGPGDLPPWLQRPYTLSVLR